MSMSFQKNWESQQSYAPFAKAFTGPSKQPRRLGMGKLSRNLFVWFTRCNSLSNTHNVSPFSNRCRDLTQPYNMRWFQIFYLILSTAFVGNTLGGLASLRGEVEEVRRKTAWERRKVSRALVDEMQPEENDARIDQYEFLVASLLQLGKISSDDVEVSRSLGVSARSRKRKSNLCHIFLGNANNSWSWIR